MVVATKYNIGDHLWYIIPSFEGYIVANAKIEEVHITKLGVTYYLSEGKIEFSSMKRYKGEGHKTNKVSVLESEINNPTMFSEWPTFSTKEKLRAHVRWMKEEGKIKSGKD